MASEQIVTLEKLRDELVKNALQIRRGDITPNEGNAIANSLKGAIQAEESRLRRDQGILVTAEPQTQAQPTTEPQTADNVTQTEAASTVPVEIESTHSVYYKLAIAFGAIGLILLVVAVVLFYRNKIF